MTRAKLLALFSASIVAGLASVAAWQAAAPARPADTALLAPLLPQSEGQSACYRGTFTGQGMDIEDWAASSTSTASPGRPPSPCRSMPCMGSR
jgi:hypothetical protein